MTLYLDASAIVKRYVAEPGSDAVVEALLERGEWVCSALAFAEVFGALSRASGGSPTQAARFREEWHLFTPIAVDKPLIESAAELGVAEDLRTVDAIHLASAVAIGTEETLFATWDRRLHAAAGRRGFELLPEAL